MKVWYARMLRAALLMVSLSWSTACTTDFTGAQGDGWIDGEDAPDTGGDGADSVVDPVDAPDGPDAPETAPDTVAPDGFDPSVDEDGDGWTVTEGDCCDHDDRVYPGQSEWFDEPYYCAYPPVALWDFNCDGEVEYEPVVVDGMDPDVTMGAGCYLALTEEECNPMGGWRTPPGLTCGEIGNYYDCYWVPAGSGGCNGWSTWNGIVACR